MSQVPELDSMGDVPATSSEVGVSAWGLVEEAMSRVTTLSFEEVQERVSENSATLVDIRDVRERWLRGTIPGSHHVPRGMLEFWADPESEYYKPFMQRHVPTIVYCAGGGRSALAADVLQKMGYRNVSHLGPGFNGWKEAGGEWVSVPVPDRAQLAGSEPTEGE